MNCRLERFCLNLDQLLYDSMTREKFCLQAKNGCHMVQTLTFSFVSSFGVSFVCLIVFSRYCYSRAYLFLVYFMLSFLFVCFVWEGSFFFLNFVLICLLFIITIV